MAEVPEHLLKRAAERKAALEAKKQAEGGGGAPEAEAPTEAPAAGGARADEVAASNAEADKTGKIPAHLLARSQAARAKSEGEGGGGGGAATTTAPAPGATTTAAPAAARVTGAAPGGTIAGPAGHTQRLLTVVKAGS